MKVSKSILKTVASEELEKEIEEELKVEDAESSLAKIIEEQHEDS